MNKLMQLIDADDKASNCRPILREVPPAEEDMGGGDICSLEEQSSTDDDKPLD